MENNIRKGTCRNYGECERAGQEFSIEEGHPFECPECGQALTPVESKKNQQKRTGLPDLPF